MRVASGIRATPLTGSVDVHATTVHGARCEGEHGCLSTAKIWQSSAPLTFTQGIGMRSGPGSRHDSAKNYWCPKQARPRATKRAPTKDSGRASLDVPASGSLAVVLLPLVPLVVVAAAVVAAAVVAVPLRNLEAIEAGASMWMSGVSQGAACGRPMM